MIPLDRPSDGLSIPPQTSYTGADSGRSGRPAEQTGWGGRSCEASLGRSPRRWPPCCWVRAPQPRTTLRGFRTTEPSTAARRPTPTTPPSTGHRGPSAGDAVERRSRRQARPVHGRRAAGPHRRRVGEGQLRLSDGLPRSDVRARCRPGRRHLRPGQPEGGTVHPRAGSYAGEGSQVITLTTSFFKGDLLVYNNEICAGNDKGVGGVTLVDVTNPLKPKKLVEGFGDFTVNGKSQTHSNEIPLSVCLAGRNEGLRGPRRRRRGRGHRHPRHHQPEPAQADLRDGPER